MNETQNQLHVVYLKEALASTREVNITARDIKLINYLIWGRINMHLQTPEMPRKYTGHKAN